MYKLTNDDRLLVLSNFPTSSIGAPCPVVVASESKVALCFYLENRTPGWDGTTVRMIDPEDSSEPLAIVTFAHCIAHYFGMPNDEAISGHPLASKGLRAYSNFEVANSSWISHLEQINSVHPYHNKERFLSGMRHFIVTFHDSVFECVASDYEVEFEVGILNEMIVKMI
jgi:hypothetical protein